MDPYDQTADEYPSDAPPHKGGQKFRRRAPVQAPPHKGVKPIFVKI